MDLKVSDVILLYSSYDLTKPPQLVSQNGDCLVEMKYNDELQGVSIKSLDLTNIFNIPSKEGLVNRCIIYATVMFHRDEQVNREMNQETIRIRAILLTIFCTVSAIYVSRLLV